MRDPAKITPLTGHVGYWLRFVSNHVSHGFSLKLAARDVTVAEWVVLRELHDRTDAAPSELAAHLGMTRGAISKLVDRLAAKALVTKISGKVDRRYQAVALTAQGRGLVPQLAALADRNDEEFFGHLKAAERKALIGAMQDIVRRRGLKTIPTE